MKKTVHKANTRGFADHGWLKSYHTFSFANYQNPERTRFGLLRVLNDDVVEAGKGFGTHPHDNMEIITIPLQGELAHKDSTGTKEVIKPGEVQIMSAGSGLTHSEFNNSELDPVNLLQIWVFPKEKNIPPRYEQKLFSSKERSNKIATLISPDKTNGALWINQDSYFSIVNLDPGKSVTYNVNRKDNGVYVFVINGEIEAAGEKLFKRDALGVYEIENVETNAIQNSEILFIEVPMS